jgi:hypothetical protein
MPRIARHAASSFTLCSGGTCERVIRPSMPNWEGSPGRFDVAVKSVHDGLGLGAGSEVWHPPVCHSCGTMEHHLALPSHPDGDGAPMRQWIDPRVGDAVPLSFVRHKLFGPQRAHDRDLLLDTLAAVLEILAERLELDGIPPDSDAQAEPASRKNIHGRGLFRHQRGLPLRKNHDAGDQLDALGDGGQEPEQDEGFVEHMPVRVWAFPPAGPFGIRAQHVVEREDMGVAHGLHSLRVITDHGRVLPDLYLWEDDAVVHKFLLDSE